ncbi:FecR family protein [Sabulibacter ruber]|uniref:FecR family protein n=1 Tax=Sabulibacter ruber TaxID=2811901 RepID=UPI001A960358|nr:FecR family protein [Sabulibacter ruber]
MNQDLINRFYKGECTPEEVKAVLEWFKNQEPTPAQERQLQELWHQAGEQKTDSTFSHDSDKIWRNIEASIKQSSLSTEQEAVVVPMRGEARWGKWARVAAAILLPLGLVWFVASQYLQNKSVGGPLVAVQAAPGNQKTIQLEDGSSIVLRPGSKVSYPVPFSGDRRDITLEGEAFFQVAKDKARPFVVKSGAIYTQALGTSFNIRYLPNDTAVSVALATGIVKISKAQQEGEETLAELVPGQQLVFNRKNQQHAVGSFENREVLGWKDGVLFFKKASLEEVVTGLENWYGVEIEVKGADSKDLGDWSYTGEYVRQPLSQVLEGIGFVKDFSYTLDDKQVQITFN